MLAASCGGDDPVVTPEAAPAVVSTSPASGAQGIEAGELSVVITYDQNVKCPSSQHSKITLSPSGTIDNVNAYGTELTIDLSGLEVETTYTLSVPAGTVSGYKENQNETAAFSLSFTTEDAPSPSVDYERDPATSLTNSNASTNAKKLYSYLLQNYGTKTISGAMGGTAWETSYTDLISSTTGEYPAIVGFDYLFMNWPPKKWDACPDYGDITPVKNAWEAGSIIQICWHWTVPSVEGETNIDNYSYDTRNFGVRNALTEGTWQHEVMNSQIEKLAGYMKLLADEDIPILFRPLHEAAGDYTWGAWFWWGYEGAEACKELWRYLRDKLENEYGLNNLIWVWTAQTSNAGATAEVSQLEEWYPGDEYVDIVGADIYASEKWTSQADRFKVVNNSVKGKKIVALTEFGNLLDMDAAFEEGAPWAWFMNWSNYENNTPVLYCRNDDGTYSWNNSDSDWKSAMSNSKTINRDDIGSSLK